MKNYNFRGHILDLLEVQRSSYCWFITQGLEQELAKFSYTFDVNDVFELQIYGDQYSLTQPIYSLQKSKELSTNYSLHIYLNIEIREKYHAKEIDPEFSIKKKEFIFDDNFKNNEKISREENFDTIKNLNQDDPWQKEKEAWQKLTDYERFLTFSSFDSAKYEPILLDDDFNFEDDFGFDQESKGDEDFEFDDIFDPTAFEFDITKDIVTKAFASANRAEEFDLEKKVESDQEYDPDKDCDPDKAFDPDKKSDQAEEFEPDDEYDPAEEFEPDDEYDPAEEFEPDEEYELDDEFEPDDESILEASFLGNRTLRRKKNFRVVKPFLLDEDEDFSLDEDFLLEDESSFPIEFLNEDDNDEYISPVGKYRIFLGEIPLMTEKCTFIINGCERVIISQIVRSPGVYYKLENKKNKKIPQTIYSSTVITKRGSWLTFELEGDFLWVKVDKKHKMPLHWFLEAMELTPEEMFQTMNNYPQIKLCLQEMERALEEKRQRALRNKTLSFKTITGYADKQAIEKVRDLLYSKIFNSTYYSLGEVGRIKINQKLKINLPLHTHILTSVDILKIMDYLIDLKFYRGTADEIDSLTNRRVRCVGELIKLQVGVGLRRLFRTINEKIANDELNLFDITSVMNPKPIGSAIKEFFGSSPLSQFMDETNPLAELTHKRRVTSLGPGGLNADHVSFSARDIHPTQYGRLCPIETPEGQSAGLVSSFASHAKVNHYGFLQTPFFQIILGKVRKDLPPIYLTADEELQNKVISADTKLSKDNELIGDSIPVRYNNEYTLASPNEIKFMAKSTIQVISIGAALIPFLEHDDANRALMGSNMQRQAVPLLYPQKPMVGTGLEVQVAYDSACGLINAYEGIIDRVTSDQIIVSHTNQILKRYELEKYRRSNQDTCVNQKPIVWPGQFVERGELLADGPAMENGELALGQNLTVAYMPWEGYNYEDAILVSERLVSKDLFTSVHIEQFEIEVRQTKSGLEELTCNIPNTSDYEVRHLTPSGIVYKGAFVEAGDVLVGKVIPKDESEELPEGKLLRAIFNDKSIEVRDSSFRVPRGMQGRILDIFVFSKENGDPLPLGTVCMIRMFLAEIRKLKIGDKISGRHGNKGIVSRILPLPDMPFLPDGTVVDVILNPLGVPSRMNVGQIFESLLGFAGQQLQKRFKILPFDELYCAEASRIIVNNQLKLAAEVSKKPWVFNSLAPGKVFLTDGRTGENFDNPIMVGKSYLLKLIHLVDDKMHARSTGPYSLVTQQPVGGKAQQGGQRFGEMEVWALEAYGAAYTLHELLTVKSDDVDGRNEVLKAIIKGRPLPNPGVPESFKVLLRELHALGLNIAVYGLRNISGDFRPIEINLMYTTSNIPEK